MSYYSDLAMSGKLDTQVIRGPKHHRAHSLRVPGIGRLMFTRDPGEATMLAHQFFGSNLQADHYDGDNKLIHQYDLGSGVVTGVGVLALANDWSVPGVSGSPSNIFTLATNVAVGTSSTAAADTDIALGTLANPTTTTAVAGVNSWVAGAPPLNQILQNVTTVNFTGSVACTEWGLLNGTTLAATTGSPFTAVTATTGTGTSTPYTASSTTVRGQQGNVFYLAAATTSCWGLCVSNSTSVITVPAFYSTGAGTALTPAGTLSYNIQPVLWDHKVFSAVNVNSGDSIKFTYQLTIGANT